MHIDLNADIGEGCGNDEALIGWVSSANIACGGHAGDADTMRRCVRWAMARGVAIGAHPGYPDREHFGRRAMTLSRAELVATLRQQIGRLTDIADLEGAALTHVKPHGQLYNEAARDRALADAVCEAVRCCDPALKVFALSGSVLVEAARAAGLKPVEEAFVDRRYRADGSLVPRGEPGAVIEDENAAWGQARSLVSGQGIVAADGTRVHVKAQTLCVHGDSPNALAMAQHIRQRLQSEGVAVRPP